MLVRQRLSQYIYLMRLNKPIGIWLLLWPTLWALWLASAGMPSTMLLLIFILGTILMRSAGCVLNDIVDRHFDGQVSRTKKRPLATGKVSVKEAVILTVVLSLMALLLVILCNALTIGLAVVAAMLALLYPFLKRYTYLPQLGLGAAFAFGMLMAFAATTGTLSLAAWFLFLTGMVWPVIYDTQYAMVDREDDRKIGVKSTAILFSDMDKLLIALLQVLFIVMLTIVGLMFRLQKIYYVALFVVALLFAYQQWLIRTRDREKCFAAFLNNNWVGLAIFVGIFLGVSQ